MEVRSGMVASPLEESDGSLSWSRISWWDVGGRKESSTISEVT
jgi:hypothetical protein